ncbi:hypothetical protein BDV11DRAFT_180302 [Aspergillus similis]
MHSKSILLLKTTHCHGVQGREQKQSFSVFSFNVIFLFALPSSILVSFLSAGSLLARLTGGLDCSLYCIALWSVDCETHP